MNTPDIMAWDTDGSSSTTEAAVEILGTAQTASQHHIPTDGLDLVPAPTTELEGSNECSTSPGFAEADTSSDGTSPASLQGFLSAESYLSETRSAPEQSHFESSEWGAWASSDGTEAYLQPLLLMLPRSTFLPYVHTFFQRLYPVFPVIDKGCLLTLLQSDEHLEQPLSAGLYSFLAALSAAVIAQLNSADLGSLEAQSSTFGDINDSTRPIPPIRPALSAQFFVSQCMQARQQHGYIEEPDEWTVLTSFFLFAYHGNLDQSQLAWYYLREAIGFVEALGLDQPSTYRSLDMETAQRRCRIFWLLFITERFVASLVTLHPSTLPC